ncbi:hypothetical protein C0431_12195 [bacterium]|nr:hypothetical protein [bacterium]
MPGFNRTTDLGGRVHQEGLHEVDAEDNSDENVLVDDGKNCEALVEHQVKGIADLGVRVGDSRFFRSEEVGALVA